jgi:hypothetical protein
MAVLQTTGTAQQSLAIAATVWQGFGNSQQALAAYTRSIGTGSAQQALAIYRQKIAQGTAQYNLSGWPTYQTKGTSQQAITVYQRKTGKGSAQNSLSVYQSWQAQGNQQYQLNAYANLQATGSTQYAILARQQFIGSGSAQWILDVTEKYYGYALNLSTGALSKFDDFEFNSLAGDLGADDTGIYTLTGTTNKGAAIPAFIETGSSDLGSDKQKRASDAYIALDGGACSLTLTTESSAQTYSFHSTTELKVVKQNLSLGAKGRFWKVKIANVAGSSTSIDKLELIVNELTRRV